MASLIKMVERKWLWKIDTEIMKDLGQYAIAICNFVKVFRMVRKSLVENLKTIFGRKLEGKRMENKGKYLGLLAAD
jgi:hypothetical protein